MSNTCPVKDCRGETCEPNVLWVCDDHHPTIDGLRTDKWVIQLQDTIEILSLALREKNVRIQHLEMVLQRHEAAEQAFLDAGLWVEPVHHPPSLEDPLGAITWKVCRAEFD